MNIMLKQIELIQRIDQLIRLNATGSPMELAAKLKISKTKLYRTLFIMKQLNAPVEFDTSSQQYYYAESVGFKCGFFSNKLPVNEMYTMVEDINKKTFSFFCPVPKNETHMVYYCTRST
ncbi:hypothetical protein IWQ47_003483 [Aquimarina sp. EL_43]|uniref:hypothetical protein n=1 Tax=unclassified Aquimarina TaxID=2627091 RepID=UPI0018C96DD1|nr:MULTISPECIES: hypothetical protein [unclassified Aquimarina]MBG6131775.1 hypothetical protein [Aquimarina sp. EL_35]MBG6149339.1 hypothetical protein [Aquimarina sp. EL_32]MBG6170398.1 hypothetical protein [Aquimarina sp. EL_43]